MLVRQYTPIGTPDNWDFLLIWTGILCLAIDSNYIFRLNENAKCGAAAEGLRNRTHVRTVRRTIQWSQFGLKTKID